MFEWLKLRRHIVGEDELSAYLDEELPPARRRKIEEHLRGCPACRARLAELRTLKQTLSSLPQAAAPRSFALTPEQARRPGQVRPAYAAARVYPVLRNAAAAVAVLFFAFVAADIFVSTTGGEQAAERGAATLQGLPEDMQAERSLAGAAEDEAPDERKETAPAAPAPDVAPAVTPPAVAPSEAGPGAETTPPALALTEPEPTAPEFAGQEATVGEAGMAEAAEEDGGSGWLRPLEGALGGAAIALVAAAFFLRRRRRLT
ncbi:MAG: zf-HC2 domain-containing protein [Dehalococcoidia bacterium]|nr:zf-HC2 domain-containing protein [Dehalococcoidia bacterium]